MAKNKSNTRKPDDPVINELKQIKNLLMLLLIKLGASSVEIDYAVRMNEREIRRIFPISKIAKGVLVSIKEE